MQRLSIERELSIYRNGKPANEQEVIRVMQRLKDSLENLGGIDREVSANTIEMKFPFIKIGEAHKVVENYREQVERITREENLRPEWGNQNYNGETVEFFTTAVFRESIEFFKDMNALHIHFEVSEEEAIKLYRGLNVLGIYYLANSSAERIRKTSLIIDSLRELIIPKDIRSMDDFREHLKEVSRFFQKRFEKLSKEEQERIRNRYKENFVDGNLFVGCDKVFNIARIRSKLRLPNGNISLEFRGIDGQREKEKELKMVKNTVDVALLLKEGVDLMSLAGIEGIESFYENLKKGIVDKTNKAYLIGEEFMRGLYA